MLPVLILPNVTAKLIISLGRTEPYPSSFPSSQKTLRSGDVKNIYNATKTSSIIHMLMPKDLYHLNLNPREILNKTGQSAHKGQSSLPSSHYKPLPVRAVYHKLWPSALLVNTREAVKNHQHHPQKLTKYCLIPK